MSMMRINIGPIHPGTHGVLRLVAYVDGDTIQRIEPHIGFLHRGVEKLMESRIYMQNAAYAEKLDYVAPLSWDDLYVSAVEQATGTQVKERAQYLRVILLEFQRIASHLLWLGTFCNDIGQSSTMFMWTFRERTKILKLLEDVSGSRMFYMNLRLGGFDRSIPSDFAGRAYELANDLEQKIVEYPEMLDSNPVFMERTKGVGVLSRKDAIDCGVSGPVLRGSGVEEDVRKSKPYYIYDKVKFIVPTRNSGDSYGRYRVRYEEMHQSISIIKQALEMMPKEGDVLGAKIKLRGYDANPAPVMVSRELPRGEGMIYMVPGKQSPYRISLRSPVFTNLYALSRMCEGVKFADIFSILGSLDIVLGEVDR